MVNPDIILFSGSSWGFYCIVSCSYIVVVMIVW